MEIKHKTQLTQPAHTVKLTCWTAKHNEARIKGFEKPKWQICYSILSPYTIHNKFWSM